MKSVYVTVPREVYEAFPPGEFHEAAGEALKEYISSGRRPPATKPRPDIATSIFVDDETYETIIRNTPETETITMYITRCLTDYTGAEL